MGLSRRMLLSAAGTLGISGLVAADEDENEEDAENDPPAPGLYGAGVYGEGRYGALEADDRDDEVDECFIATAAEGTKSHPHVVQLRDFRDTTLRSSVPGRLFIRVYYATSPPIAEWIARSDRRRRWTRAVLVRPLSRAVTTAQLTDNEIQTHD